MHLYQYTPPTIQHSTAILLVHGAFHGAWMWEGNFLDYYLEQGFETYSIDLSGRGKGKRKFMLGLGDLVDDLATAIQQIDKEVIVVGHSMGCLVAQKYLEKHSLKGAIFLCPLPPFGMHKSIGRLMVRSPKNFFKFSMMSMFNVMKGGKNSRPPSGIYAPDTPKEVLAENVAKMNGESKRLLTQIFFQNVDIPAVKETPIQIIGAEDDGLIFKEDVIEMARRYELPYQLFSDVGHAIIFAPNWKEVATETSIWMQTII